MAARHQPTVDELITHVLGAPPEFTAREIAADTGVPLEHATRLWRAMGFPDVGDARAFTRADADSVRSLMKLVNANKMTFDDAVEIVRGVGQTTARLAEWQIDALGRTLLERGVVANPNMITSGEVGALMRETKIVLPVLQRLMVYAWRRQLATSVARSAGGSSEIEATTGHLTVGFADIVGFTRISRELPDNELAALIEAFDRMSSDIVAATGARLIKTLGDEIMFVANEAQSVAQAAVRLHAARGQEPEAPKLRIGIATGSVITRMGDVFGTTVNRASRLTVMARPQSTFVDAETVAALADDDGFTARGVRPRRVRGFGLMRSWSLQPAKSN